MIGGTLIYLGVKKDVEPLLLVPIGFGCLLVNIPLGDLMHQGLDAGAKSGVRVDGRSVVPEAAKEMAKDDTGFLRTIYNAGIANELFPLLIFIGIGAMTDFGPLLENPKILLFGAAGQCGIFLTLLLALALGFKELHAVSIAIIGACDGPTAIYVSAAVRARTARANFGRGLFLHGAGADHPAADHEGADHREGAQDHDAGGQADRLEKRQALVPDCGDDRHRPDRAQGPTADGHDHARKLLPRKRRRRAFDESLGERDRQHCDPVPGRRDRRDDAGRAFLKSTTLAIFALGFVAICLDTVVGVLFGKAWYYLSGGKINPLIGAAGISAFPMAARVVQAQGQRYNKQNFLLMHAMGANCGGQIGSVAAAAVMLSVLKGMGLI